MLCSVHFGARGLVHFVGKGGSRSHRPYTWTTTRSNQHRTPRGVKRGERGNRVPDGAHGWASQQPMGRGWGRVVDWRRCPSTSRLLRHDPCFRRLSFRHHGRRTCLSLGNISGNSPRVDRRNGSRDVFALPSRCSHFFVGVVCF